jgi:hypothetical protein
VRLIYVGKQQKVPCRTHKAYCRVAYVSEPADLLLLLLFYSYEELVSYVQILSALNLSEINNLCLLLLHAGFLLGLLFNPGDGGDMFLQNIG